MEFETIRFEKDGHVATVTLNRPDALNAFTTEMADDLGAAWRLVREDDSTWVVVVTGAGRAFCSGADNRASKARHEGTSAAPHAPASTRLTAKQNGIFKPVIAAVNGLCAGGGFYFVGDADIVICADDAAFVEPHVTWGRTAAVEPILLSRRIPLGVAMRMALVGTAERLDARRALEVGLVTEVVPAAQLVERAQELARIVARGAPRALQGTVEAVWKSLDLGLTDAVAQGVEIVERTSENSEDLREGLRAFAEKREPRWRNR